MLRLIFPIFVALSLALVLAEGAGAEAWAQGEVACAPGETCAAASPYGAWAMIALGLLFFAVWLMPRRRKSEEEDSSLGGFPMLQVLQRRIDRELTGWRRHQWPVLGLFFVGLGVAYLFGWR